MYNFEQLWDISENKYKIQQKKYEWIDFLKFISDKKIENILEIGCYDGGSTYSLCHFAKNMITIDSFNPSRFDTAYMKSVCNYEYIGNSSHNPEVYDYVSKKMPKIDLLFIDGDHSYEGSLKDYEIYKTLLNDTAYVAFHDIVNSRDHRIAGCLVSKTWAQVRGNVFSEFIYDAKNNKYSSENSEDALWGGIGIKTIIKN